MVSTPSAAGQHAGSAAPTRHLPLTRELILDREAYWQQLTAPQRADWFASRRAAYVLARYETIEWFAEPVEIGASRDIPEQVFVALGINPAVEPCTLAALIIDNRGNTTTQQPVLLGRLWKFSPYFELVFDRAALVYLARTYGLQIDATTTDV